MFGHIDLEFLGVGSWRWLPSGLLLRVVKVVREVLGDRVTNFPPSWET